MSSNKKRKYGDLSARPIPVTDPSLLDDVFQAFTGRKPAPLTVEPDDSGALTQSNRLAESAPATGGVTRTGMSETGVPTVGVPTTDTPMSALPEPADDDLIRYPREPEAVPSTGGIDGQPSTGPGQDWISSKMRGRPYADMSEVGIPNAGIPRVDMYIAGTPTNDVGGFANSEFRRHLVSTSESVEHHARKRRGFLAIPNEVVDRILPNLSTSEQAVLLRLYRLSWGFGRDTCSVGHGTLAAACNISRNTAITAVRALISNGLIERLTQGVGAEESTYRVLVPQASIPKTTIPNAGIPNPGTPILGVAEPGVGVPNTDRKSTVGIPKTESNKETREQFKQNTHTPMAAKSVGVGGSRFSLEECRRYADHLQQTGQGITNPGGYALTIFRSAEADAFIEAYLNPEPKLDFSKCPGCRGTGFRVLERHGVSAAMKCGHDSLHSPGRDFSGCPDCEGTGALVTQDRRLSLCKHERLDQG